MANYHDVSLSPEQRAAALLKEMTMEQKIAQLQCRMFNGDVEHFLDSDPYGVGELAMASPARSAEEAAALNRAAIDAVMRKTGGIPPVLETEAISGFMGADSTSFPSGIAMASTFDPDGLQGMTDIIRKQMLAQGVRRACSPVMDVARDPRWGRVGETYGEDPTLGAAMSTAFVKGLQTKSPENGIAACGKHFLGYAMGLAGYNSGSNHISPRELREVYAKPFQAAITDGKLMTVMNSYGAVDGAPVVGDKAVLTGLLREEMGFEGLTVSDYGAVSQLIEKRISGSKEEAAVRALSAGMDVECPNPDCYPALEEAVQDGKIDMDVIDRAVFRILVCKFKLGLFENPYPRQEEIALQKNEKDEYARYSLRMARESIVLLKNDGILPLGNSIRKIAVIGPRSNSVRILFGGYSQMAGLEMSLGGMLASQGLGMGERDEDYFPGSVVRKESPKLAEIIQTMMQGSIPTILEAIRNTASYGQEIHFLKGCDIAGEDRSGFGDAVRLAASCDAVIYNCGGKYGWGEQCTSGEGRDTSDLTLPGVQEELLRLLCETGKPVIVVHGDTRPMNSLYAKEHAAAILEAWTPGQSGGQAVADVLFGRYNPAGRLPITAVEHAGQIPMYLSELEGDLLSLDQSKAGFNSFSNGHQKPLYFFGEGLSYSTFRYDGLELDEETEAGGTIHISVNVTNTSDADGEEVVQLYIRDEQASMLRPVRELAGFHRVWIPAGKTVQVEFRMSADQTAFLDEHMQWIVEAGELSFMIGPTPRDIRLSGRCRIQGTAVVDPKKRGFCAKAESHLLS